MLHTMDEKLDYVCHLTRRIEEDDILTAIQMVLMDLKIPDHSDNFETVLKAVQIKMDNFSLHMTEIYDEISKGTNMERDAVEQALRSCIKNAWTYNYNVGWDYFFPENLERGKIPSNKEFISHIARVMKLWNVCRKDVC